MKPNPAAPKMADSIPNMTANVEKLTPDKLKVTLANIDYEQGLKRAWRSYETSSRRVGR